MGRLEQLADALDEVKRLCPGLPLLGVVWMHVKHPIHPVQEELLKDHRGTEGHRIDSVGVIAWRFCCSMLLAAQLMMRLLLLRMRLRRQLQILKRQPFDLVAKSWSYEANLISSGCDFYYGDLQERLQSQGVGMLILTGNPSGMGWKRIWAAQASASFPQQLPEICLVPFSAPFRFVFQQLVASLRLRRLALRAMDPLVKEVAGRASQDVLSGFITPIGFSYWIGQATVRFWRPKAFMTLYEGYGWEQCLWRGIKSLDPACKTIGYQHTILLRHNLALLQGQDGDQVCTRPDVVLCLGPRTQSMLRSSHSRSELLPFGTFRRSSDRQRVREPNPQRRTVLVLPEGYLGESKLLFDRAISVARRLPGYRFILRCHPVMPFEKVQVVLEEDWRALRNVGLSTEASIEADFAESSVVLYRGSSSVLYAVLHGLKPIYLHNDQFFEIDPLFELKGWRQRAASVDELEGILRGYGWMDPQQASGEWKDGLEYVESYAISVDQDSVDRLLSSIGTMERVEVTG